MPTEHFRKQLEFGKAGERRIIDALESSGLFEQVVGGNANADFDFVAVKSSRSWRVEVKDESRYASSAYMLIETYQGNPKRPSGIMTSKSDITIHIFGSTCRMYETREMRLLVKKLLMPPPAQSEIQFGKADNGNGGLRMGITCMHGRLTNWFQEIDIESVAYSKLWNDVIG